MKLISASLLSLALQPLTVGANPVFAGYQTSSDVSQHSYIDLDVAEILTHASLDQWTAALDIYKNGKNSAKSSSLRSLKGFSDNGNKLAGVAIHSLAVAQYTSPSWADEFVEPLFAAGTTTTTLETALHFIITAPYVFYELQDAINDCSNDDITGNDAGVRAWDEGVAFFVGSTEANSLYSLMAAAKQELADEVMEDFSEGSVLINAQACKTAEDVAVLTTIVDDIHSEVSAAAILLLKDATANNDAATQAVLGKFLLPEIAACNTDKAASFDASHSVAYLYDDYSCMGVECHEVDEDVDACTGEPTVTTLAGYTPDTDVSQHAFLDKDILRIGKFLDAGDYKNAYNVYSNGRNSKKTGSLRNLQALSKGASKMNFPEAATFASYYGGDIEYSNTFIEPILLGTDGWANVDKIARKELIMKSIQYSTLFMYVMRELHDAVGDCEDGDLADNKGSVHAWDEGWAFFAGSLEGVYGEGSGQILHALGEKRDENFTPVNDANAAILEMFTDGRNSLNVGDCASAEKKIPAIRTKMMVPVIQGALRYAWKMANGGGDKDKAEGWAFARAVLPFVEECSVKAANTINKNQDWEAVRSMSGGVEELWDAYLMTFECLGLDCDDIGELDELGAPQCDVWVVEVDAGGSAAGLKAGLGGAVVAVLAAALTML